MAAQLFAFILATQHIETWMNAFADGDEIAQMVMETNGRMDEVVKTTHMLLSDSRNAPIFDEDSLKLMVSRIIWPVHFEDKTESSVLSIADACAWAIRKRISRERDSLRFYEPLAGQLANDLSVLLDGEEPLNLVWLEESMTGITS